MAIDIGLADCQTIHTDLQDRAVHFLGARHVEKGHGRYSHGQAQVDGQVAWIRKRKQRLSAVSMQSVGHLKQPPRDAVRRTARLRMRGPNPTVIEKRSQARHARLRTPPVIEKSRPMHDPLRAGISSSSRLRPAGGKQTIV